MRKFILLLFLLLGCQGRIEDDRERVVVERVVERVVVEHVSKGVAAEDLFSKVVALGTEGGGKWTSYCGGVWIDQFRILTAYHCLRDQFVKVGIGSTVKVMPYLGERLYVARAIKLGIKYDLALLEVGEDISHQWAEVGQVSEKVGNRLHIVGHTRGLTYSYIQGWVSAYRSVEAEHGNGPFMQMTAPIYYGDSGGGVFNEAGQLVGITSFIYKVPNVAFAVHLNHIQDFLQ